MRKIWKCVVAAGLILADGAIGLVSNAVGIAILVAFMLIGAYAIASRIVDRVADPRPAHAAFYRGVC